MKICCFSDCGLTLYYLRRSTPPVASNGGVSGNVGQVPVSAGAGGGGGRSSQQQVPPPYANPPSQQVYRKIGRWILDKVNIYR